MSSQLLKVNVSYPNQMYVHVCAYLQMFQMLGAYHSSYVWALTLCDICSFYLDNTG